MERQQRVLASILEVLNSLRSANMSLLSFTVIKYNKPASLSSSWQMKYVSALVVLILESAGFSVLSCLIYAKRIM